MIVYFKLMKKYMGWLIGEIGSLLLLVEFNGFASVGMRLTVMA